MARRQFSAITYNTKYQHNVVGHALNRLQAIYDAMYQEAAKIGTTTGWSDPKKEFFLKDFPKAEAKIDALLKLTAAKVTSLIEDGNDRAWQLSDDKNAEMVQELAKRYKWPEERVQELSRRNLAGVKAFQERVVNGMNLSERVWDFQKNDKQKLEWALELGLAEGKSAQELSRSVRSYLREPNKLFRRVRDKYGNLKLSKAAKAYHPGRGVYRSSYKNALRMTMTENNMAYRTADYDHWNKMDFVIGQEVKLSSVHSISNTLGKKYPNGYRDMCDDLAGVYPKEFKFTGWHPHCRCYVVAKLADYDEMNKWARMTDQERARYQFQGKVKEMPAAFNAWIDDNAARIEGAGSLPYFITDNYVDGDINKGLIYEQQPNIMELAAARHDERSAADVEAIKQRWSARHDEYEAILAEARNVADMATPYSLDLDLSKLEDLIKRGQFLKMRDEAKLIQAQVAELKLEAQKLEDLIPDASSLLGRYSLADLKNTHATINQGFASFKGLPLQQQKQALEDLINNTSNKLAVNAYKTRLEVVKIDIKVEELAPAIANISSFAQSSSVSAFKDYTAQAQAFLDARNVVQAEAMLKKAEEMKTAVERFDTLKGFNTTSAKIKSILQDTEDLLNAGDISGALAKLQEGEKLRAKYEHDNAVKRAREEAKRRAAEEAKKKAEEEAKLAALKPKVKDVSKVKSFDELKDMLGDDLPAMLEHYTKSVKRKGYTRQEYINDEAEIERKFKELFDNCDYAHCCPHELLEEVVYFGSAQSRSGYLIDGISTNLTVNERGSVAMNRPGWSLKGKGYDEGRRSYGHFAFGFQEDQSRVPKSEWLKHDEYYRCGTPVPKGDRQAAWDANQAGGYGDAQLILRKDRVVATWTMDNSLCQSTIPSLTTDPKICSLDNKSVAHIGDKKYKLETITQSNLTSRYSSNSYIELQYVPMKSTNKIGPRDIESITLSGDPSNKLSKEALAAWKKAGVDIYCVKGGKVELYQKGDPLETPEQAKARREARNKARKAARDAELKKKGMTAQDKISELLAQRVQEKLDAEQYAKEFLGKSADLINADISKKDFKPIQDKLKKGNVMGARMEAKKLEELIKQQNAELDAFKGLIPDVHRWHKDFTLEELKGAHKAISDKFNWLENRYAYKDDIDRVIGKLAKEMEYVEFPELLDPSKTRHKTWEIAKDAYRVRRDQLIYQHRRQNIDTNMAALKAFKTKNKEFKARLVELEEKAKAGRWGDVEELIAAANVQMQELEAASGERVIKLGESSQIKFSKEDFDQARKDAAKWFKSKGKTSAAMKKAFKEADDYMSQYASEMWAKLSQEEKHVLWLYTDGSKYINDEMLGKYSLRMRSWIDKSYRNGLADANVLTSIIEKAPALRDDMWLQSGKSTSAFEAMFGVDLRRADLSQLVGKEGSSELFMSCHSARDGAFTRGASTGDSNNVVLSIYMPKGTKGAYMEPFASFGDSKRGAAGMEWDGTKQKCAPSDQVEFLLQRGSKFRITNAKFDPTTGKWYVDVDLIEQSAQKALKTDIPHLDWRPDRYRAPAS